jgi:hypothetical protein
LVVRQTVEATSRPDRPFWTNRWLLVGIVGGAVVQVVAMSLEGWRSLFQIAVLPVEVWIVAIMGAVVPAVILRALDLLRAFRGQGPAERGQSGQNALSSSGSALKEHAST